jgi:hypothetical protein
VYDPLIVPLTVNWVEETPLAEGKPCPELIKYSQAILRESQSSL